MVEFEEKKYFNTSDGGRRFGTTVRFARRKLTNELD